MESLGQGTKTEKVHCLPWPSSGFRFTLLCHYHPENVLFCLGHPGVGRNYAMILREDGHAEGWDMVRALEGDAPGWGCCSTTLPRWLF